MPSMATLSLRFLFLRPPRRLPTPQAVRKMLLRLRSTALDIGFPGHFALQLHFIALV